MLLQASGANITYRSLKFENRLNVPSGRVVVLSSTTDLKNKAKEIVNLSDIDSNLSWTILFRGKGEMRLTRLM